MTPVRLLSLIAIVALLPHVAHAQDAEEVPPWAEDWRYVWLDAKRNGSLRLSASLTHPLVKLGDTELFAVLEVKAINFPQERRPSLNAALILDRSGSMNGARLNVLKKAATDLVAALGPADRLAIVRVSDETEVLESAPCTPENKQKMYEYIQAMKGAGGSDLSAGLADAYDQVLQHKKAFEYHRVLLVSDGRPNKGMADAFGLADIARRVRETENIHTSTLTIGKDSDVELMRGIATQGWGFTGNLEDASHLFRVGKRLTTDVIRRAADRVELTVRLADNVNLIDVLDQSAEVAGNTLLIRLHELANNERLRITLRMSVLTSSADGTKAPILTAQLKYHDGLVDRAQDAEVALEATVTTEDNRVGTAIDDRTMALAAKALASRAMARAQDHFDEGHGDDARRVLSEATDFLRRAADISGIATRDELGAVLQLEERLFPAKRTPAPDPKKKKRRRG